MIDSVCRGKVEIAEQHDVAAVDPILAQFDCDRSVDHRECRRSFAEAAFHPVFDRRQFGNFRRYSLRQVCMIFLGITQRWFQQQAYRPRPG